MDEGTTVDMDYRLEVTQGKKNWAPIDTSCVTLYRQLTITLALSTTVSEYTESHFLQYST